MCTLGRNLSCAVPMTPVTRPTFSTFGAQGVAGSAHCSGGWEQSLLGMLLSCPPGTPTNWLKYGGRFDVADCCVGTPLRGYNSRYYLYVRVHTWTDFIWFGLVWVHGPMIGDSKQKYDDDDELHVCVYQKPSKRCIN